MPPIKNRPTLISLFAGCGGSSLGYKQSGYDIRLAVEWDKIPAATYRRNFPNTPLLNEDIASISIEQAMDTSRLNEGELDILDGSPPCQGFSSIGRRQLDDPRNQLFKEYLRFLSAFKPKILVMENVSGMITGRMRGIFSEIMQTLRGAGYNIICGLLNAWWYGVPQDRERVIFIGLREDIGQIPTLPQRIRRYPITVMDALDASLAIRNSDFNNKWRSPNLPACTLCKSNPPDVVPCICDGQDRPILSNKIPIRSLTIAEAKILQGFPESFDIQDYFVIGNSVPPPMSYAIGKHILQYLG